MEARDLMINDLVWYVDEPIKVKHNYGKSVRYDDGKYSHEVEQSYLKPIFLTEDMIRANIDLFKDNDDIDIVKDTRGFILDYSNGVLLNMGIEYVHDLQHALRLCGLSELADNFKVE